MKGVGRMRLRRARRSLGRHDAACALSLLLWAALLTPGYVHADATTAYARLRLGAGLTQRVVDVPNAEGPRQLDLGPAPAAMLGIDGGLQRGHWLLGLGLRYRTSLAARVNDVQAGAGAAASQNAVRSHQFEAGLRPGWSFGQTSHAAQVALFAGYQLRAFSSVAVLRVPRFTLHGPLARLELEFPLKVGLRLRIAPEVQWIASITRELEDIAQITQSGLALGGEAQLSLPLGESFDLCLHYRESHAMAQTRSAQRFSDVERYLLLEVAYRVE